MNEDLIKHLGPLAALAGVGEGDKGDDVTPSDDRGTERNKFRERMTFEPLERRKITNRLSTVSDTRPSPGESEKTLRFTKKRDTGSGIPMPNRCFVVSSCLGA